MTRLMQQKTSNQTEELPPRMQARLHRHFLSIYGQDSPSESAWARLAQRLDTSPALATEKPIPSRIRAWTQRMPTIAGRPRIIELSAALGVLCFIGFLLWTWLLPVHVNAQVLLEQARAAQAAPLVDSYYVEATLSDGKRGSTHIREWGRDGGYQPAFGVGEAVHLQVNAGARRQERLFYDTQGVLIDTEGTVLNEGQLWEYRVEDGRTEAINVIFDPSQQEQGDELNAEASLTDLLASYSLKCDVAQYQGETTIVGQAAYIIELRQDLARCPRDEAKSGAAEKQGMDQNRRTAVYLDKQTLLVLKWEQYTGDGTLQSHYEVTQVAYNLDLPESTFMYSPPPGATVITKRPTGASPK